MLNEPGDAVIIHTGWSKLWGKDNARYTTTRLGLGVAAAEWLARQDPMIVGADNGPFIMQPLKAPGFQRLDGGVGRSAMISASRSGITGFVTCRSQPASSALRRSSACP